MLKKLFGAAVVAFLFSGLAAQAATIQVSGGSGGLITDFGDRAFQIDNAAGDYNLEVTGAGDVGIDFDLIASPSFTVGNFLVSIAGTGFLVSGTVDMINANNPFRATLTAGSYILSVLTPSNFAQPGENFTPTIDITAQVVPLPAAAWMFLSVIAGAGLLRRKSAAK